MENVLFICFYYPVVLLTAAVVEFILKIGSVERLAGDVMMHHLFITMSYVLYV